MGKGSSGWSRSGRAGERRGLAKKKREKITKRRLVHIFSVKTAAAESGCGETGVGKSRTMVIFRLIFYVCSVRERSSLPPSPLILLYPTFSPSALAFVPPRILLSPFICLHGFFWLGSIDYHEIREKEANGSFSRVSLLLKCHIYI